MSNILRLVDLRIISYAGINSETKLSLDNVDPEGGVVIVFPDGQRYTELEADQGAGKTSVIECLKEATGGMAAPNAINSKDGDKKFRFTFYGLDGELYEVRATKTTYDLWHIMTKDGEVQTDGFGRPRKQKENSPKSLLQKIVGRYGISPLQLKEKSGADQISWLKEISNPTKENLDFEKDLDKQIKEAYNSRTKANGEAKEIGLILKHNKYYQNYEQLQDVYSAPKPEYESEAISQAIKSANEKQRQYDAAISRLYSYKNQSSNIRFEIEALEKQRIEIENAINEKSLLLQEVESKIDIGTKYVEDNKDVPVEVDKVMRVVNDAQDYHREKNLFDQMVVQKKKKDHLETESIRLTNRYDELRKAKAQYIKTFTPEVEGLSVYVPDEEEKREGIYYQEKPLNFLAESELWEMAAQLWEKLNVKIIYVENVSSLGSGAIEIFNKFIDNGGYIFASKMNRKEKNLRVNFNVKIPE